MKRVKITLKEGCPGKKLWLFPSAEAIYLWACALDRGEQLTVPGIEELLLEPGGFIEAELRGFEYAYENAAQKPRRFDLVRLGKASRVDNASGLLVTIHTGWACGPMLPMRAYSDADVEATVLQDGEGKIDLPALFKDDLSPQED